MEDSPDLGPVYASVVGHRANEDLRGPENAIDRQDHRTPPPRKVLSEQQELVPVAVVDALWGIASRSP